MEEDEDFCFEEENLLLTNVMDGYAPVKSTNCIHKMKHGTKNYIQVKLEDQSCFYVKQQFQIEEESESTFQQKIQNEIQTLIRLNNVNCSNIATYVKHAYGTQGENATLISEILMHDVGTPLSVLIQEKKNKGEKFSPELIKKWYTDLISALYFAELGSVFHGDVQPEKIGITSDNIAILFDFSSSKAMETFDYWMPLDFMRIDQALGNINFMAPEVKLRLKFKYKTHFSKIDVYSLAITMYNIITLEKMPYSNDSIQTNKDKYDQFLTAIKEIKLEGENSQFIQERLIPILLSSLSFKPKHRPAFYILESIMKNFDELPLIAFPKILLGVQAVSTDPTQH